ncbi:MAG: hypothetical protein IPI11_18440 [Haliscomenobacter sp.]|nr:hypothetical protein [Haliscomenobacter sp.]
MPATAASKSAFDLALHDPAARLLDIPLYQYLGGQNAKPLHTDMTVSMLAAEAMAKAALRFKADGFRRSNSNWAAGFRSMWSG